MEHALDVSHGGIDAEQLAVGISGGFTQSTGLGEIAQSLVIGLAGAERFCELRDGLVLMVVGAVRIVVACLSS